MLKNLFAFSVVVVRAYGASRKASLEVLKKDGAVLIPVIKDITQLVKDSHELFVSSGLQAEIALVKKGFEEVESTDPEWAGEGEKAADALVEAWTALSDDLFPDEDEDEETEETH